VNSKISRGSSTGNARGEARQIIQGLAPERVEGRVGVITILDRPDLGRLLGLG